MNRSTLVHFAAAVVVTGFAWTGARAADDPCRSGYVWREAFPGDRVCVTPPTRTRPRRTTPRPAPAGRTAVLTDPIPAARATSGGKRARTIGCA